MRVLPHSLESEMAILGALLIYPKTAMIIKETNLQPEDFFSEQNRSLFENIDNLMNSNQPIDMTTLTTRLVDNQQLAKIGGSDYLLELTQNSTTPENIRYYIEMVQGKAQLRNLIEMAQKIQEVSFDSSLELEEAVEYAEREVLRVTRSRNTGDMKSSKEVVVEVLSNIRNMSQKGSNITGLSTGYKPLDNMTSGFQRGDLIILAARPSLGKTAFALNLALKVALLNNATVGIFSLEMPAEHLIERMLAAKSRIEIQKLKTGSLKSDREWFNLDEAAQDLHGLEIYIDDSSTITLPLITSKCRKLKMEKKLDLVIIDYIQLISGSKKTDNRQQEVSDISRGLKQLARELEVPVIALSQLSRLVERREKNKPMLSDLRESGSIEQDADLVMFLSRDDYQKIEEQDDSDKSKPSEVEVHLAKHRNGSTGEFTLAFEKEIGLFSNFRGKES